MGKYSNTKNAQPEFATKAAAHTVDSTAFTTNLNGQAPYVAADGDITVVMADEEALFKNAVQFTGVKGGSFLPIVADYIVPTTAGILVKDLDMLAAVFSSGDKTTSGIEAGTYKNVATTTSGSGTGLKLDIVVTAGSPNAITSAVVSTEGTGYAATNTITIGANALGASHIAIETDALVAGDLKSTSTTVTGIVTFE